MSTYASIGSLVIDVKRSIDLATAAENPTPQAMRPALGSVAQLAYKLCKLRYSLTLNQVTASGSATLTLQAGAKVLETITMDLSAGQTFSGKVDVDLSEVSGSAGLFLNLNVTGAADAGTVGELVGVADVEVPLIVSGC